MITFDFRTLDNSGPLPQHLGTVVDGEPVTLQGLMRNSGDEPVMALRLWLENDLSLPLTFEVSVNGQTVPDVQGIAAGSVPEEAAAWTAGSGLPVGGLPPGDTLSVTFTCSGPSSGFLGLDSCQLRYGAR